MSQKRFNEYQATLISDDDNKEKIGQMPPGRYAGFDTITYAGSGSTFGLSHSKTGVVFTKANGTIQSRTGTVVSQAGVVVQEDAAITGLVLGTNVGNATSRIDLIVMTHSYILVGGGSAATYSVIQGTFGTYTAPALANAATQVIIGEIHIKAGATQVQALNDALASASLDYPDAPANAFNAYYRWAKAPGMGGRAEAVLDLQNKFTARVDTANEVAALYSTVNTNHVSMHLPESSNTINHADMGGSTLVLDYIAKPASGTSGIRMSYKIADGASDDIILNISYAGAVPTGYAKIKAPLDIQKDCSYFGFGTITNGVYIAAGDVVILEYINSNWVVVSIVYSNTNTNFKKGKVQAFFAGSFSATVTVGTDSGVTMSAVYNPYGLVVSAGEVTISRAGWYKVTVTHTLTHSADLSQVGNKKFGLMSSNAAPLNLTNTYYISTTQVGTSSDRRITYTQVYHVNLALGNKVTAGYQIGIVSGICTIDCKLSIEEL